MGRLLLAKAGSTNPWENLAYEDYLLSVVQENELILFMYQNDSSVVIGRNQNAWQECNHVLMHQDNILFARRRSGGGTVYHDMGNLNFSFIMPRSDYNFFKQIESVIEALGSLGIEAAFTGKSDISLSGEKISGNAFYFSRDRALHHGTLLVNADIEKLRLYLSSPTGAIDSHAVGSIRSQVTTLSEIKPYISIDDVTDSLAIAVQEAYRPEEIQELILEENGEINKSVKHYRSWQWRFGHSPEFRMNLHSDFSWGRVEVFFHVKDGIIKSLRLVSEELDIQDIEWIQEQVEGSRFSASDLTIALDSDLYPHENASQVLEACTWLIEKA